MTVTDVAELIGALLVVVGVALIWGVPAAVILAGVLLVGFAVMYARQGRDRVLRWGRPE